MFQVLQVLIIIINNTIMEVHFCHWIKRVIVILYLTILTLFSELHYINYDKGGIMRYKLAIFIFFPSVLWVYILTLQVSLYKSQLQIYISQFWKKSELQDVNLQLREKRQNLYN